jgi:hypothetical protein
MTTALAIALCGGAFWLGTVTAKQAVQVADLERRQEQADEDRRRLTEIVSELKTISEQNLRRLEILER